MLVSYFLSISEHDRRERRRTKQNESDPAIPTTLLFPSLPTTYTLHSLDSPLSSISHTLLSPPFPSPPILLSLASLRITAPTRALSLLCLSLLTPSLSDCSRPPPQSAGLEEEKRGHLARGRGWDGAGGGGEERGRASVKERMKRRVSEKEHEASKERKKTSARARHPSLLLLFLLGLFPEAREEDGREN